MIQCRVIVRGRVQGVGFRAATVRQTNRYPGLRGFVRNLADGSVEAVFSGEDSAVRAMVEWCGKGPLFARVESVSSAEEAPDASLPEFQVRRQG
ncbi:MAG: acylphosphatase [Oligoflexia bacterium]|nr:acylphosphatase [Oligoflexia bacterium]